MASTIRPSSPVRTLVEASRDKASPSSGPAHASWLRRQSASGLALCVALALFPNATVLDLALLWIGTSAVLLWARLSGWSRAANAVTLTRLLAVLLAIGASGQGSQSLTPNTVSLVLACALAADLFDGWLARRMGVTEVGAILDMESDQWVVFALASYGWVHRGLPGWVLWFPALRYVQVLASERLGIPVGEPRPVDGDNRRGRIICAATLITLWLCSSPFFLALLTKGSPWRDLLLAGALGLLGFSFASDFQFLWRKKTTESGA